MKPSNYAVSNWLNPVYSACPYEAEREGHLGRAVDPDAGVEQDVITQLFEQPDTIGQLAQVTCERHENVQDGPGHVGFGGLGTGDREGPRDTEGTQRGT